MQVAESGKMEQEGESRGHRKGVWLRVEEDSEKGTEATGHGKISIMPPPILWPWGLIMNS